MRVQLQKYLSQHLCSRENPVWCCHASSEPGCCLPKRAPRSYQGARAFRKCSESDSRPRRRSAHGNSLAPGKARRAVVAPVMKQAIVWTMRASKFPKWAGVPKLLWISTEFGMTPYTLSRSDATYTFPLTTTGARKALPPAPAHDPAAMLNKLPFVKSAAS